MTCLCLPQYSKISSVDTFIPLQGIYGIYIYTHSISVLPVSWLLTVSRRQQEGVRDISCGSIIKLCVCVWRIVFISVLESSWAGLIALIMTADGTLPLTNGVVLEKRTARINKCQPFSPFLPIYLSKIFQISKITYPCFQFHIMSVFITA